jgi:molybdenum cofactor cytidylyltransferase
LADDQTIAAVVLAAGQSRRFGADKLLHPLTLDGETLPLAAHSLRPWLAVFRRVTVVVRPQADALRAAIEQALGEQAAAIAWVACADAESGMGHSLAAGVGANRSASGWLVGLADMPAVPAAAIAGVRAALAAGAPLAAPARAGRRGHPVGFGAGYGPRLLALQGDAGARALLEQDAASIAYIAVAHDGIFADVDTPVDIAVFQPHQEKDS